MRISRWRVAIAGGAIVVLAIAGAGVAQAALSGGAPVPLQTGTALQGATANLSAATLAAQDVAIRRIAGLRFARNLVHAVVTVDRPSTGLLTVQIDHGTISAIGTGSITIAEAGGTSVTVATTTSTRVRVDGAKSSLSALKTGADVYVASKLNGSSATAALIVVPRTSGASGTGTGSGGGSGTSSSTPADGAVTPQG